MKFEAYNRKCDLFFAELAKSGVVSIAARAADIDYSSLYRSRREKPEFAERWAQALDTYVDTLETEAHRRAVEGTDKGVWHQGVLVGTEKQYSDSLLALMLKAKRKEYRDNSKVEISGPDGGAVQVEQSPTEIARDVLFVIELGMREAAKKKQQQDALADGADLA